MQDQAPANLLILQLPTWLRGKHVCSTRPRPQVQFRVLQRTFTPAFTAHGSRKFQYARLAESVAQRVFDQDPRLQIWQRPNFFVPFQLPARSLGAIFMHIYSRQMPRRPALKTQGSARRSLTTRGSSTDNNTRKAGEPSTRRALQADQSSYQSNKMRSNHRPGSPNVPNLYSRQHPNGRQNYTKVTPNRSWRNYFPTFPTRSYFMQPPRELRLQFSTRSYACPRIWRKIYLKFDFDSLRAARREWSWGKPASAHSTHIFAPLHTFYYQFQNCKGSQK
ncbi:Hypothetical_protein [Hexamita inflata]|uniref:Hypothetical_protein n=1 Tax=Hexamita inflata TaxID=28002 RepID=A0AA86NGZ4_9EUKA|nr:Hypothetical protein HINF_LOCUS6574 [Hexamita inflata]CAI9938518.1 Hypothetical protein HINF_LOCUS26163 [Hexamita inflata]